MSPTEARKRLLIAESEVHRALLSAEFAEWRVNARGLTNRVAVVSAATSAVVVAVAGWAAMRRGGPGAGAGSRNWIQAAVQAISVVSTLWMTWRSGQEGGKGKTSDAGKEQS